MADLATEWVDAGEIYQPVEIQSEVEAPLLGLLGLRRQHTTDSPSFSQVLKAMRPGCPRRGFSAASLQCSQTVAFSPCPRVVFPPCARIGFPFRVLISHELGPLKGRFKGPTST